MVAVVLAETREQAEDAAEVVTVSATDLPVVNDLEEAAKDEVVLHEDLGTNVVVHWSHGGGGDQSVFESAPVIMEERYTQPRLIPNAIEARGCLAYGIPAAGEFTLVTASYRLGEVKGVIGVLGPTRMPYDKIVSLVDHTSRLVEGLFA